MRCLFALVFLVAVPAFAFSTAPPQNRTGETPTSTCLGCHSPGANPGPVPTVTVEGLGEETLFAGTAVTFTLRIHTNDRTGGTGATCGANRCAGFATSTTTAGTFVIVQGQGTRVQGTRANDNETTHSA